MTCAITHPGSKGHIPTSQIRIRDPFIVPSPEEQVYYLFGSTDSNLWDGEGEGFLVYKSTNLQLWSEPQYAFTPPTGFWATSQFWAPEVHFYRNKWYMFASFKSPDRCRGVQILRSDRIQGPYAPITEFPVTPEHWECLDGTFYVDKQNKPWIIFCHEWLQIGDGAICAAPLSEDLTEMVGKPILLFHASDAPWSEGVIGEMITGSGIIHVTDGPFLYYAKGGALCMLWSSFSRNGYALGIAESCTGQIDGPWRQQNKPFFTQGGHGMLFDDFYGNTYLALHSPNADQLERLTLIPFV